MGSSELQQSYKDWSKRIAAYESMGVPSSVYAPIASHDMQRTFNEDAYPMSDLEANIAVAAAATKTPPVTESPRKGGKGILGDISSIASNVIPDVGNLITGLPRGLYDTGKALASPSSYKDIYDVVAGNNSNPEFQKVAQEAGVDPSTYNSNKLSSLGDTFRLVANTPLLNLIPGATDAAGLTNKQGRRSLAQHPVSTALDLAGLGGGIGKAAGSELAARTLESTGEAVDPLSATSALAKGHVVQAGARAVDRTLGAKLAGGTETGIRAAQEGVGPGQLLTKRALAKVKHDSANNALNTLMARTSGDVAISANDFSRDQVDRIFAPLNNDPAAIQAYSEKELLGDIDNMTPEELSVHNGYMNELRPILEAKTADQLTETPEGLFPNDSSAAKHYRGMDVASKKVAEAQSVADKTSDTLGTHVKDYVTNAPYVKHFAESDLDAQTRAEDLKNNGKVEPRLQAIKHSLDGLTARTTGASENISVATSDALINSQLDTLRSQLDSEDWKSAGKTLTSLNNRLKRYEFNSFPRNWEFAPLRAHISHLKQQMNGIKSQLYSDQIRANKVARAHVMNQRAETQLAKAKGGLTKESDAYHKALQRTPPAHLTPLLRQAMREGTVDHIRLSTAMSLDEIDKAIKDVRNTNYISDLKKYLGTKEYTALFTDSLNNLLEQTRDGRAPLFIHSVRTGREARSLSTRIKSTAPESQVRSKGFDLANSLFNVKLGVLSEYINSTAREGTQQVVEKGLVPFSQTGADIDHIYMEAAERKLSKGRTAYTSQGDLARHLRSKEYVKWNPKTGRRVQGGVDSSKDNYIPKDLMQNFEHYTQGGRLDNALNSSIYQGSMKIFRTSVLYGPRHFAHVVIGGLMPLAMAHPSAFRQFVKLWPAMKNLTGSFKRDIETGKRFRARTPDENLVPSAFRRPIDYGSDEGLDHELHRQIGTKYGKLIQQVWKAGSGISAGLERFENTAQTMYQAAVRLDQISKGADPIAALGEARKVVVNMDTASPFERTIMKQIMPFYSFTRFASLFLMNLPFDHPLRVSFLASMSNQAQEEWGTGLPQTMMDLFFIGSPDPSGSQTTVNLKNINPFRSIANEFTLGGFLSSLNPAIEAGANALGVNTLSGSSEMYPEISYNAATGDLQTTRPSGDTWGAIESYIPEFTAIDGFLGLSQNLRSLKQDDRGAYNRELYSVLNLPFTPSNYNLSEVRGNTALNLYKGASQAVQNAQRTGDFSGDINRYNLVPFNNGTRTELYTPQQISAYYEQLRKNAAVTNPGINPSALIPTSY